MSQEARRLARNIESRAGALRAPDACVLARDGACGTRFAYGRRLELPVLRAASPGHAKRVGIARALGNYVGNCVATVAIASWEGDIDREKAPGDLVIAGALVMDPEVIVADEPVSMLDVSIRTELLRLMLDLRVARIARVGWLPRQTADEARQRVGGSFPE